MSDFRSWRLWVERRLGDDGSWYLMVLPKILTFSAFLVLPFLFTLWMSLHEWHPLDTTHQFVGVANYERLMADPIFWDALFNTVGYAVGMVVFDVPIALALAWLLNRGIRGTRLYSAAIFTPVVTSWIVVSMIWIWLYNPDYGLVNQVLSGVGLPTLEWLRSTKTALASILIMSVWKHVGFNMVIFLAGLRTIPEEYYEAARLDGANAWEILRYVTLPLLMPITFFVIVVTLITSFRLFAQVFVMTGGGPVHSSYSLVFYYYETAFTNFEFGYAGGIAVVLFVFVFSLGLAQRKGWGDVGGY